MRPSSFLNFYQLRFLFSACFFEHVVCNNNNTLKPVSSESDPIFHSKAKFGSARHTSAAAPRCGGVITDVSGYLSYKEGFNLETNERCVWVIRVPGAMRYMVHAPIIGFTTNETHLIVTGLALERIANNSNHFIPSHNGSLRLIENANVLIVTLSSGSGESEIVQRGFRLEYTVLADPTPGITLPSTNSKNYLLNVDLPTTMKHPPEGAYSNDELTVLIIAPMNNIYERGKLTTIQYLNGGLDQFCGDHLDVFKFNTKWQWEYVGRICGDVSSTEFDNDDLTMFVFETNHNGINTGFKLVYYENLCPE